MAETKKAEFARGVQQLEDTQDNFEEVLRQQPNPPTYAQASGMTPPAANNGYPVANNGYPVAQPVANNGYPMAQPVANNGYPMAQPVANSGYPMAQPLANSGYPMAQPAAVMTNNINVQMAGPGGQVIVREVAPMPDNTCAIIHSCCIFWLFCWPLGLAAFIVAVSASSQGSANEAAGKIRTSHCISWSGFIIGVILIILIAVALAIET